MVANNNPSRHSLLYRRHWNNRSGHHLRKSRGESNIAIRNHKLHEQCGHCYLLNGSYYVVKLLQFDNKSLPLTIQFYLLVVLIFKSFSNFFFRFMSWLLSLAIDFIFLFFYLLNYYFITTLCWQKKYKYLHRPKLKIRLTMTQIVMNFKVSLMG